MNILVPVDFSECSLNALRFSIDLAKQITGSVYVLHSYRLTKPFGRVNSGKSMSIRDELDSDSNERFERLRKEIGNVPGVSLKYIVDIGFAVDTISSNVREYDINLIVMGTKGNGMIHQVFGSTTLNVIKKVDCPVLSVPNHVAFNGLQEIAIASDYDRRQDIKSFKTLNDISRELHAHLHVLTLNSSQRVKDEEIESGELKLTSYFPDHDLEYHFKSASDVENGLNNLVENLHADMLVLIPRSPELFKSLFGKSVTKSMILHSTLPIMALPA